ncbi:MAG: hypothetical protein PF447_01415 [Spirochaetaceae bacterium]|nr:hypothetical protein [Spirochaetaceae bacterium]
MKKSHLNPSFYDSFIAPDNEFSLSELAVKLMKSKEITIKDIEDIRDKIYKDNRFFYDNGYFIKKSHFFSEAKFKITLTDREIEEEMLIPGHRWHPFVSRELKPWDITLYDYRGVEIPKKERVLDWENLKCYHLLLGEEQIFSQCQIKTNLFGQFFAEFPHYDISSLVEKIKKPKMLSCRVLDYEKGHIQIERIEEGQPISHEFIQQVENAFFKVFEKFGPTLALPEQIEWAVFMGDSTIKESPKLPLASVIHKNPKLGLFRIGLTTLLWRNDGSLESTLMKEKYYGEPKLMIDEGFAMAKEFLSLFSSNNPFVSEALGPLIQMTQIYGKHYQGCIKSVSEKSMIPQGKETQLLITITQYSKCLLSYLKDLSDHPPSKEAKEIAMTLLLETEGLMAGVEPFLRNSETEEP